VERLGYGRFAGDASQRVHSIVSAAEREAAALIRDAEREAELIRREGQAEADRLVEEARVRADELVAERMRRISELSDGIVEQTELLFDRIDAAGHVRRQLDGLLRSLGEAAEAVSGESSVRRPAPRPAARASTRAPEAAARPGPPARASEPGAAMPPLRRDPAPPPARPEPARSAPEPMRSAPEPADRDDKGDARFDGARLVALQMAVAGSTREEVHDELRRAFRLQDPSSILDDVFGVRRAGAAS
jgi:vacuolar-type H+-ATPase subunit H